MKRHLIISLFAALSALASHATSVRDAFTFTIQEGWNAVCLPLAPTETADEIFADWPTDAVGFYDQAAFLRSENGMKQWVRGNPGVSSFSSLVANGIYVFNVTNEIGIAGITKTIYGIPEPTRISWHVAISTNAPLNFVGIFAAAGTEALLTQRGYFQGLNTGWTYEQGILRDPWGYESEPTLDFFYGETPTRTRGGVVAMDAAKVSDWSGAFFVSPYSGLDFGTNACQGVVSVRNDAATNRTVRVSLRQGVASTTIPTPPALPTVLAREENSGGSWLANLAQTPFEKELAAGETLRLVLAVDRTTDAWAAAGTEYGGIIEVADVSSENPTHFQTALSLSVTSDGGAMRNESWPKGLWQTIVKLDHVSQIVPKEQVTAYTQQVVTNTTTYMTATNAVDELDVLITNYVDEVSITTNLIPVYTTEPLKAGSTMTMRLLLHVDEAGQLNLMQRANLGTRRLSSLVIATDDPIRSGSGTFGDTAAFDWTIAAESRSNPFRHARHPDHKPGSLFAINNALRLTWDAHDGTAWNPTETLSGAAEWRLGGLRREGEIITTGTFTMRRISKQDLNELQKE